jgi:hypothetical protein
MLLINLLLIGSIGNTQTLNSAESVYKNSRVVPPQLKFDLRAVEYLSDSPFDQSKQQKAQVELNLKSEGFLFSNINILAGTFSLPKSFYIAAPEVYVGFGSKNKSYFAVGRFISDSSFIDQYYNIGLFNSYFTNDFIEYKEQGLTGLHLQIFNQYYGARVSWTPYFFPNQGPQVHEENGHLISSNRWAQRPPPQFQFADQSHEIIYAIRDYKLNEIIENQGQLISLFFGAHPAKPLLQLSYANQPLNEIPLTRDTYGTAQDFIGHVNLSPVVTYHEVRSADLNLEYKNLTTHFSYEEDLVRNKTALENETLQFLAPLKIYGFYSSLSFESFLNRPWQISLAAAELTGGEIKDFTADGKESVFVFSSQRTQFKSPLTLGLSTEVLTLFSKPLLTNIRWTYDRSYKGTLLSTQFDYQTMAQLNLNLGFDFIGVEQSLPTGVPGHYLEQNQANDRVYGGLQYAF